jgi:peroxiredoxin
MPFRIVPERGHVPLQPIGGPGSLGVWRPVRGRQQTLTGGADQTRHGRGIGATSGVMVNPATLRGTQIIYCYPMTGRPGIPLPDGWDAIPGARGCTPQSCAFRDHHAELQALGADVYGLSTQTTDYQYEAAGRLHLPFPLLSDATGEFADALRLPTMQVGGQRLIRRLTLIVRDARIVKVFYPVFPPDRNAAEVVLWLRANG